MHLPRVSSTFLSAFVLLISTATASILTIAIPPSAVLPNPNTLPPSTHATLTALSSSLSGEQPQSSPLRTPLTRSSTFVFRNLTSSQQGSRTSYLLDIHSHDIVFSPLRVDVGADGDVLGVWEMFRGNGWDNKGLEKFSATASNQGDVVTVDARVMAKREFFEQRPKFSPLSLFKNPMILLAVVALGITFGMPYLMDNMDPEMRAEFEKQSAKSPIAGAANKVAAGSAGGGAPSFDLAGWMAGTSPGPMSSLESAAEPAPAKAAKGGTTGRDTGGASSRRRG
ncbi:hypothetical protein FQN54_007702 [Arachnomyces sp. PD_36]|nr:hypothetical protein FQN54_007702 [Arachnomyces sp. PD_36]